MELGKVLLKGKSVNLLFSAIHPKHGIAWTDGTAVFVTPIYAKYGNSEPLKLGEFSSVTALHWSQEVARHLCYLAVVSDNEITVWRVKGKWPDLRLKLARTINKKAICSGCLWHPVTDILVVLSADQAVLYFHHELDTRGSYTLPDVQSGQTTGGSWSKDGLKLAVGYKNVVVIYSWPGDSAGVVDHDMITWKVPSTHGNLVSLVALDNKLFACTSEMKIGITPEEDVFSLEDSSPPKLMKISDEGDILRPHQENMSVAEELLNVKYNKAVNHNSSSQLVIFTTEPECARLSSIQLSGILKPDLLCYNDKSKMFLVGSNSYRKMSLYSYQDNKLSHFADIDVGENHKPKGVCPSLKPTGFFSAILTTQEENQAFLPSSKSSEGHMTIRFHAVKADSKKQPKTNKPAEVKTAKPRPEPKRPLIHEITTHLPRVHPAVDEEHIKKSKPLRIVNLGLVHSEDEQLSPTYISDTGMVYSDEEGEHWDMRPHANPGGDGSYLENVPVDSSITDDSFDNPHISGKAEEDDLVQSQEQLPVHGTATDSINDDPHIDFDHFNGKVDGEVGIVQPDLDSTACVEVNCDTPSTDCEVAALGLDPDEEKTTSQEINLFGTLDEKSIEEDAILCEESHREESIPHSDEVYVNSDIGYDNRKPVAEDFMTFQELPLEESDPSNVIDQHFVEGESQPHEQPNNFDQNVEVCTDISIDARGLSDHEDDEEEHSRSSPTIKEKIVDFFSFGNEDDKKSDPNPNLESEHDNASVEPSDDMLIEEDVISCDVSVNAESTPRDDLHLVDVNEKPVAQDLSDLDDEVSEKSPTIKEKIVDFFSFGNDGEKTADSKEGLESDHDNVISNTKALEPSDTSIEADVISCEVSVNEQNMYNVGDSNEKPVAPDPSGLDEEGSERSPTIKEKIVDFFSFGNDDEKTEHDIVLPKAEEDLPSDKTPIEDVMSCEVAVNQQSSPNVDQDMHSDIGDAEDKPLVLRDLDDEGSEKSSTIKEKIVDFFSFGNDEGEKDDPEADLQLGYGHVVVGAGFVEPSVDEGVISHDVSVNAETPPLDDHDMHYDVDTDINVQCEARNQNDVDDGGEDTGLAGSPTIKEKIVDFFSFGKADEEENCPNTNLKSESEVTVKPVVEDSILLKESPQEEFVPSDIELSVSDTDDGVELSGFSNLDDCGVDVSGTTPTIKEKIIDFFSFGKDDEETRDSNTELESVDNTFIPEAQLDIRVNGENVQNDHLPYVSPEAKDLLHGSVDETNLPADGPTTDKELNNTPSYESSMTMVLEPPSMYSDQQVDDDDDLDALVEKNLLHMDEDGEENSCDDSNDGLDSIQKYVGLPSFGDDEEEDADSVDYRVEDIEEVVEVIHVENDSRLNAAVDMNDYLEKLDRNEASSNIVSLRFDEDDESVLPGLKLPDYGNPTVGLITEIDNEQSPVVELDVEKTHFGDVQSSFDNSVSSRIAAESDLSGGVADKQDIVNAVKSVAEDSDNQYSIHPSGKRVPLIVDTSKTVPHNPNSIHEKSSPGLDPEISLVFPRVNQSPIKAQKSPTIIEKIEGLFSFNSNKDHSSNPELVYRLSGHLAKGEIKDLDDEGMKDEELKNNNDIDEDIQDEENDSLDESEESGETVIEVRKNSNRDLEKSQELFLDGEGSGEMSEDVAASGQKQSLIDKISKKIRSSNSENELNQNEEAPSCSTDEDSKPDSEEKDENGSGFVDTMKRPFQKLKNILDDSDEGEGEVGQDMSSLSINQELTSSLEDYVVIESEDIDSLPHSDDEDESDSDDAKLTESGQRSPSVRDKIVEFFTIKKDVNTPKSKDEETLQEEHTLNVESEPHLKDVALAEEVTVNGIVEIDQTQEPNENISIMHCPQHEENPESHQLPEVESSTEQRRPSSVKDKIVEFFTFGSKSQNPSENLDSKENSHIHQNPDDINGHDIVVPVSADVSHSEPVVDELVEKRNSTLSPTSMDVLQLQTECDVQKQHLEQLQDQITRLTKALQEADCHSCVLCKHKTDVKFPDSVKFVCTVDGHHIHKEFTLDRGKVRLDDVKGAFGLQSVEIANGIRSFVIGQDEAGFMPLNLKPGMVVYIKGHSQQKV